MDQSWWGGGGGGNSLTNLAPTCLSIFMYFYMQTEITYHSLSTFTREEKILFCS